MIFSFHILELFSVYTYIYFFRKKMGTFCGYVRVNDKKGVSAKCPPQGFDFNISSGTWYKCNPETLGQIPHGKGSSFLMRNGFFLWIHSTFKNCYIFRKSSIIALSAIISLSNFQIIYFYMKDKSIKLLLCQI
jgi:hypothetical protein